MSMQKMSPLKSKKSANAQNSCTILPSSGVLYRMPMSPKHLGRAAILATTLVGAGLAGCVAVADNHTTTTGHQIDPAAFAQVEPGKSKEFVVGLLGEPSEKVNNDDGTETWRWRYTEERRSMSGFIVLFAATNENRTVQTRFVQFKGGLVTRAWTE